MCELGKRKPYPSEVTDAQWKLIEPFTPPVSANATVPTSERRELVNAILYVLRTGCSWRQMPHDMPNDKAAHHYFRIWTQQGIWEPIMAHLRKHVLTQIGREAEPSAAILDSQSIKAAPVRGQRKGYDAGEKIYGRKLHILVDTQGLRLAVKVHTVGLADCLGAPLLLKGLRTCFLCISHLFADKGYRGFLLNWIMEELGWTVEMVPGLTNDTQEQGKGSGLMLVRFGRPHPGPRPVFRCNVNAGLLSERFLDGAVASALSRS